MNRLTLPVSTGWATRVSTERWTPARTDGAASSAAIPGTHVHSADMTPTAPETCVEKPQNHAVDKCNPALSEANLTDRKSVV